MPNRLFYTITLSSGLLKEYKYKIDIPFEICLKSDLVISLSDSQMLKSIRDITGQSHKIDLLQLEEYYQERDRLKKSKNNTKSKRKRIKYLQNKIYEMMYIPEYITVVMESEKDYKRMFEKGFVFNGKKYVRGGCSASQARVSTIVFIEESIKDELKTRLDNGRDLSHPLAPSKYNAYFGLYSSASRKVTTPNYCIIPDFCNNKEVKLDWSIETDWDKDDILEERTIDTEFNRFDGSGLIHPRMAEKWALDLGEDYVPCQFIIRYAFTKGLVNEFDFIEWCMDERTELDLEDRFFITDIYGNKRDLRDIDIILTEGMSKLWDSWETQEDIDDNAIKNGIEWRVTKYTPKKDKEASTLNYQYVQTLDLDNNDIEELCRDTIDYIEGVNYQNPYYSLLFMLGNGMNEQDLNNYMLSSDNYWLKSLILDHHLLDDKYSKEKIRDMIIRKIELACLGRIYCRGNYQFLVPDSYAFMEWATGMEVKGILGENEFYSKFWEDRDVDNVAYARSPQVWRAEWVKKENVLTDEQTH